MTKRMGVKVIASGSENANDEKSRITFVVLHVFVVCETRMPRNLHLGI